MMLITTIKHFVPSLFGYALLLCRTSSLPSGAANCVGGRAAVGVGHLSGHVTSGTLEDGGLTLSLGGKTLQAGVTDSFPKGQDLTWTLTAHDLPFRGFLIRTEDRSHGVGVDTTQSLSSDDALAKIAEVVCINAFNVGGVTHNNNSEKSEISGTFRMDEPVGELQVDTTVVIKNRNSISIYYYTGYVVSIVDTDVGMNALHGSGATNQLEVDQLAAVDTSTNSNPPLVSLASGCNDNAKCSICQGDCNKNSHCADGLECFFRPDETPVPGCSGVGDAGTDYCYRPRNDTLRIRSLGCSQGYPCDSCEGMCQTDDQCGEGLRCFLRPDLTPVPRCEGPGISGRNYCFKPLDGLAVPLLLDRECNHTNPCGQCHGACEEQSDCADGLDCFFRPDLTPIPGCSQSFVGVSGKNYCFKPQENSLVLRRVQCEDFIPCKKCQGECFDDSQCQGNLECMKRSGSEPVSGCIGIGVVGRNYCYDPEATFATMITPLTPSPVQAPSPTPQTPNPTRYQKTLTVRASACSEQQPCEECVGDCDGDSQCKGILQCYFRSNNGPVPGCRGTGVFGTDYCALNPNAAGNQIVSRPTASQSRNPPSRQPTDPRASNTKPTLKPYVDANNGGSTGLSIRPAQCSPMSPCGECQGDCDFDEDCDEALQCFYRSSTEPVPGCAGQGTTGADYCAYNPAATGANQQNDNNININSPSKILITPNNGCSAQDPCFECQGDCNTDNDCVGVLQCFFRRETEQVPGCGGSGISGHDYCAFNTNINTRRIRRRDV